MVRSVGLWLVASCTGPTADGPMAVDTNVETDDTDTDADTDADSDTDTDADSDADSDTDTDADTAPTGDTGPAPITPFVGDFSGSARSPSRTSAGWPTSRPHAASDWVHAARGPSSNRSSVPSSSAARRRRFPPTRVPRTNTWGNVGQPAQSFTARRLRQPVA